MKLKLKSFSSLAIVVLILATTSTSSHAMFRRALMEFDMVERIAPLIIKRNVTQVANPKWTWDSSRQLYVSGKPLSEISAAQAERLPYVNDPVKNMVSFDSPPRSAKIESTNTVSSSVDSANSTSDVVKKSR